MALLDGARTNMEAPEGLSLGSKEHTNIVKGKRTKRVRPQSPIPFSNARERESENYYNGHVDNNNNKDDHDRYHDHDNNNNNNIPTTSSTRLHGEEEEMANCLILLAQGNSRPESPKHVQEDASINYAKYSSRKFLEAATLGCGRAGYYVYECKTCNKTFPSFQALGGHRASHKKPKAITPISIDQEKKQVFLSSNEKEFQFKTNNKPLSLQLNSNKSKVHECSICGAEFTSGQALGGHMRRHRAPVGTNPVLSLTPMVLKPEKNEPRKKQNVLSLDLDLNLPAPEDDKKESKFAVAPKQQQQQASLVFSTAALIDCHY